MNTKDKIKLKYWEDDLTDYNQENYIDRFEVFEYWGMIDTDMLIDQEVDIPNELKEFDELLPWRERRFDELLRDGWIEVFSKKKNHTHKTIYKLSLRSQRMMTNMYNQLSGEELSEEPYVNPIFKKKVKYTDKVYRNMIKKMNKITRQRQRPSQE